MAKRVPGKEEFNHSLAYYRGEIERCGINLHLATRAGPEDLKDFDEIVLATGVYPRRIDVPGIENPRVVTYIDVLNGKVSVGAKVAVIGAGGIGFDIAEFLSHVDGQSSSSQSTEPATSAMWKNAGLSCTSTNRCRTAA